MKKIKALLYCCKAKKQKDLLWSNNLKHFFLDGAYNRLIDNLPEYLLNGTIVAECDFDVEEFDYMKPECLTHTYLDLSKKSCLTDKQMYDYLKGKNGYAIHIKNLHIFDKPRELSEYYYYDDVRLTKAPQNMRYAFDEENNEYILISIKPQWLCKILNGEKDIEIRKKSAKGDVRRC